MRRIGVVGLLALVCSTCVVALGAAGAAGQAEPATFGYTVERVDEGVEPGALGDDGRLVLAFGDDVGPAQTAAVCRLVTIELATGVETHLSAPPSNEACAGDLAFAPDGTLYGLLQGIDPATDELVPELVRFDTATGAAEVVGDIGTAMPMFGGQGIVPFGGLTFDAAGELLVLLTSEDDDGADPACRVPGAITTCLYRIDDPSTPAAVTFLGQNAIIPSDEPGALGSTLFATCDAVYSTPALTDPLDPTTNVVVGTELVTVDPGSGASATIGAFPDDIVSWGADSDPADGFWGIGLDYPVTDFSEHVISIDPGATPVAANGAPITSDDEALVQGLAIAPLDCTPDPIVLEPTFTG